MKKKVILFTTHRYASSRRAGFHWLADSFCDQGFDVFFVTCLSGIDAIRRDPRFTSPCNAILNKPVLVNSGVTEFVFFDFFRPFAISEKVDFFTGRFFRNYGKNVPGFLVEIIKDADVFVFESTYFLMYSRAIRLLNPVAKFIYRVSDDMDVFNYHFVARDYEKRVFDHFDLISSPSLAIHKKFRHLNNSVWEPHGVPTEMYDLEFSSPFVNDSLNFVFAGTSLLDSWFVDVSAALFPDVMFHYIGPFDRKKFVVRSNVVFYGELDYGDVVPYIKNATAGLNPLVKGGFGNSNKVQQYAYVGIPVVQSSINPSNYKRSFFYKINDSSSVHSAILAAINAGDADEYASEYHVNSWRDIVKSWVG